MNNQKRNDFILPDELGWTVNDEIKLLLSKHNISITGIVLDSKLTFEKKLFLIDIQNAETIDNFYAVIKEAQK
jgi:hypothetical protein